LGFWESTSINVVLVLPPLPRTPKYTLRVISSTFRGVGL
jgi:hypothetical protein